MFDAPGPRLFHLPPGVDFPAQLVAGLRARLSGHPPEAMARVELFVNAAPLANRLRAVFDAGPPALLPRIRLVTDLADPLTAAQLPRPVPPLRRRLELTGLVARLLDTQRDLAPRAALFDLSDSLATLMDEMLAEDVSPATIAELDVTDQSGHWQRALTFLQIVQGFMGDDAAPDTGGYQRRALDARLQAWADNPPDHPVIVAGSTGSRGTTHRLMQAVARLPQGAVVLPGFDTDLPDTVWQGLTDAMTGEDHPQFRLGALMRDLGLTPADVAPWTGAQPPAPGRNRTLSLALRPAPVTHQWLSEGPHLPDLAEAMQGVTLLEATTPRAEALAIALRLRQAVEDGTQAVLITPDRMLTRRVTSALARWGIVPDDSAGTPVQLTPPGRFLRHVAALFTTPLTAEALLTLLKHPLTHTGADRGGHLLNTRDLELHIRATAMPYPAPDRLHAWGQEAQRPGWAAWLADTFCHRARPGDRPLADWVADHVALAETIATGSGADGGHALWDEAAGRKLHDMVGDLRNEAPHGTDMSARDYADLFGAVLARATVPDTDATHPAIRIEGPQEARALQADLVILGGLNEGAWPALPPPDPWLNRKMRHDAGLLLPDRNIGLSAHDFQQAAAAPQVWLTRALKSDDAETVPARWINRLTNLLRGLPDRRGPQALDQMIARGAAWLDMTRTAETPIPAPPAPRPSPAPPAEARPRKLSVTQVKKLVRDPYAIYADKVLRLRPLDPLQQAPDALMRGILVHRVFETYVKASVAGDAPLTPDGFARAAACVLDDPAQLPFPTMRLLWQARLFRVADWFTTTETARQARARPVHFEVDGRAELPDLNFVLTAQADRIDLDDRGCAHLYDYKTGSAPGEKEQRHFDKQLLLESAMVERGAFEKLAPVKVAAATYIALQPSKPAEVPAPLDDAPPAQVWQEFQQLIAAYLDPSRGFTARRAMFKDDAVSDYDQLARFGEWDVTDPAQTDPLT